MPSSGTTCPDLKWFRVSGSGDFVDWLLLGRIPLCFSLNGFKRNSLG